MKKVIVVLAVIMTIVLGGNNKEEIIIPNESIRVRVIANSSKKEDIKVKETLKNNIKPVIYNLLKDAKTIEEARDILKEKIPTIKVEIEKNLKIQNINTSYKIKYGENYFPKKTYKGIEYEEGEYESLVITLGEGKGENWWCILFPPLCMIDEKMEDIEYKSVLKEILNKYLKNDNS